MAGATPTPPAAICRRPTNPLSRKIGRDQQRTAACLARYQDSRRDRRSTTATNGAMTQATGVLAPRSPNRGRHISALTPQRKGFGSQIRLPIPTTISGSAILRLRATFDLELSSSNQKGSDPLNGLDQIALYFSSRQTGKLATHRSALRKPGLPSPAHSIPTHHHISFSYASQHFYAHHFSVRISVYCGNLLT